MIFKTKSGQSVKFIAHKYEQEVDSKTGTIVNKCAFHIEVDKINIFNNSINQVTLIDNRLNSQFPFKPKYIYTFKEQLLCIKRYL